MVERGLGIFGRRGRPAHTATIFDKLRDEEIQVPTKISSGKAAARSKPAPKKVYVGPAQDEILRTLNRKSPQTIESLAYNVYRSPGEVRKSVEGLVAKKLVRTSGKNGNNVAITAAGKKNI